MDQPRRRSLPVARASARPDRRAFCGAGLAALGLSACSLGAPNVVLGGLSGPEPFPDGGEARADGAARDLATTEDLAGGACAGPFDAGLASAIAIGDAQYVASQDLFVCRDAGGLYAMTSLCPHAQCTLTKQSTRYYCGCHGATFDLEGQHPTSPAHAPLAHYALCIDASGHVLVDPTTVVAATTRA